MSSTPTHVAQADNELANARAYGQGDAVRAAEKRLAAAGRRREAVVGEVEADARRTPPQNRTSRPLETTNGAERLTADVYRCDEQGCDATARSAAGLAAHKRSHRSHAREVES